MRKISATAVTAIAVTAVLLSVMTVFFSSCEKQMKLMLYDTDSGKIYAEFPVSEGTEFSVEFIHSVNLSPVKDIFVIRKGQIVADSTVYSAFGAGVQTELGPGQTLEYDSEGNMVVSGFNMVFPKIKYIVGTVYDHVLFIQGESISLTELCGKNAHVTFELKS